MALIVFLSTMSLTYDLHFCGDTLVDVALFSEADSCGMKMEAKVNFPDHCSVTKKGCCTDKKVFVEGQSELKQSLDHLTFQQQFFIASYAYSYVKIFKVLRDKLIPSKNYSPPNVIKDILLIYEVFLI